MKLLLAIAFTTAMVGAASAQYGQGYGSSNGSTIYGTGSNSSSHSNSGYTNSHGTYVAPHYSTNPNSTQYDNYSTRGNVNPYTGTIGTRTPRY